MNSSLQNPLFGFKKWFSAFWLILRAAFGRRINGSQRLVTLGEVFRKYESLHLPTVTETTRLKLVGRVERAFTPFFSLSIALLTPEKVAEIIQQMKASYVQGPFTRRYNFHKELRDLKALLAWWSDQFDYQFRNPVRPFHYALAVIEELPEKERRISVEETLRFFEAMESESIYRDIAIVQFYCGGRIGEIAGIQIKNIDTESRILKIKEVISWVQGVPKIKHCPKNGKSRNVYINDTLYEIFSRRMKTAIEGCPFLFHDHGKPLRYNRINVAFNEAWKKASLNGKFSGSHLMRYASAQTARKLTGSLDAAASVTGHQSMKMAEHYGKLDSVALNQSSVLQMEEHLEALQAARVA